MKQDSYAQWEWACLSYYKMEITTKEAVEKEVFGKLVRAYFIQLTEGVCTKGLAEHCIIVILLKLTEGEYEKRCRKKEVSLAKRGKTEKKINNNDMHKTSTHLQDVGGKIARTLFAHPASKLPRCVGIKIDWALLSWSGLLTLKFQRTQDKAVSDSLHLAKG